jgi:hypothetical protein
MSAEQYSAPPQPLNTPNALSANAETNPVSSAAASEYIARKLIPQHEWLDRKARQSKIFHYSLLGISVVATTLIVLANGIHLPLLSSTLAVVATISTGAAGILRSQENWVRYRSTANALQNLKLNYDIGAPPFNGPDRYGLMIQEAEKIFSEEQSRWAAKVSEAAFHPSLPIH